MNKNKIENIVKQLEALDLMKLGTGIGGLLNYYTETQCLIKELREAFDSK